MNEPTPITFTDEQLLAAIKAAPEPIQTQIAIIAMQIELTDRRAADEQE
jgi:hypothetical protein